MALVKKILIGAGGAVALALVSAVGFYAWAAHQRDAAFSRHWEAHDVDFPVPWPLTPEEMAVMPEGTDFAAVAQERAQERGRHLLASRYLCSDCHGTDFGGAVMVDSPAIGHLAGQNLTSERVRAFEVSDFDHIVRHGVKQDGTVGVMPAGDFAKMTDQELSDIISVIRAAPRVERDLGPVTLGPVLTVLVGTGQIEIKAVGDDVHEALPPETKADAGFGSHIAQTCVGCHGATYAGGPITGGDPSWPPAANLTPHADGLGSWTYEDFQRAIREGKRPDGSELKAPMPWKALAEMSDTELQAVWAFLQTVPPAPDPK